MNTTITTHESLLLDIKGRLSKFEAVHGRAYVSCLRGVPESNPKFPRSLDLYYFDRYTLELVYYEEDYEAAFHKGSALADWFNLSGWITKDIDYNSAGKSCTVRLLKEFESMNKTSTLPEKEEPKNT